MISFDDPQVLQMVELSAPLVGSPTPWANLTLEQQGAFRVLIPNPSFNEVQRHFLNLWCLSVTSEQINQINSLMPSGNIVEARKDINDNLYLGSDLLSDALDGRRLSGLLPILETLNLVYCETITWPIVDAIE